MIAVTLPDEIVQRFPAEKRKDAFGPYTAYKASAENLNMGRVWLDQTDYREVTLKELRGWFEELKAQGTGQHPVDRTPEQLSAVIALFEETTLQ